MQSPDPGGTAGRRPGQHHRRRDSRALAPAFFLLLFSLPRLHAQSSLLEARIVSGEGQVCRPGNRLPRPLVIEVTDETGMAVEGALISFRVPESGVSGTFRNGIKSEILTTDGDGRVAMRGLDAGGFAGRFQIRMTIAKGNARTGAISNQFIAPSPSRHGGGSGVMSALGALRPRGRWMEVGGLVAAVAAAGLVKSALASGGHTVQLPPTIGPPIVTIGKP